MHNTPVKNAARYLRRLPGNPTKYSNSSALVRLTDHHCFEFPTRPAPRRLAFTALAGTADGSVVVSVSVTGTAVPFKFTVAGLKVRFMPPGAAPTTLIVTGLGTFDNGVMFIVVMPVCPAVTVMAGELGRLKSGVKTFTQVIATEP